MNRAVSELGSCAGLLESTFMTCCIDAIDLAHYSLDSRQQIFALERLHNVAVRPLLLPPELVTLIAFRGAENNGDILATFIVLQVTTSLESIAAWHHDVEYDEIGFLACHFIFEFSQCWERTPRCDWPP